MPVRPGRSPSVVVVVLLLLLLALAGSAAAQQLLIGQGATLVLGDARLDVGCRDVAVDGTLQVTAGTLLGVRDLAAGGDVRGGSGTVELSGNLSAPAWSPQTGIVQFSDGCGRTQSAIEGAHSFHILRVQSATGHTMILPAAITQSVLSRLELTGEANMLLNLQSDTPGSVAYIRLAGSGSQLVDRISVRDVGGSADGAYLAPNLPAFYRSVDLGNSPRFFGDAAVPIPALSLPGLLLLGVLLALSTRVLSRQPFVHEVMSDA